MKQFIQHQIPSIERIDSLLGRRYKTPEGNLYPSVTTIVSATEDRAWLDEWVAKVGKETADKITKEATDRGTLLHDNCERYLLGHPLTFNQFQYLEKDMFSYFLPVLEEVDYVCALETTLWSDKLKCAGTVDLIARFRGSLGVLDWKNSKRYKSKEEISGYFKQTAAYAAMFFERTGIKINDLYVIMAIKDYGLEVYHERTSKWLPKFIESRKQFDKL